MHSKSHLHILCGDCLPPYKPSVPNSYSVTTKDDIHMKMFTDILQQSVKSSF
eukprot:XP_001709700.1 Hypothetical protein GL50803_32471 [Giardia lamblia ATCC 50803]